MSLETKLYSRQSNLLVWERPSPFSLKLPKAFCAESKFLSLVSLFCFITARGFVFVGEAIRTPHIGIFLPRLIYLQGNLFGGHKISPRKIPTKFITGPVPLICSLGQQSVAGLGTRVLFLLFITNPSELKRASLKSGISILLEMSFHLN